MLTYGDDVADCVHSYADDEKSTVAGMRGRVSNVMAKCAEWASKKTDDLDATSSQLVSSVSDAVSARPLLAVGIAIIAGSLVSKLFSQH